MYIKFLSTVSNLLHPSPLGSEAWQSVAADASVCRATTVIGLIFSNLQPNIFAALISRKLWVLPGSINMCNLDLPY
ncbi:hypothetical protein EUTSA_v10019404mg [Eutrema salsugineum]|uniref:Uncharacterized protein n=1 Tax=Eutrema salsugineum TaxID=72664 RepID=V4KMN7_EUTSA|nr:hypothetical protein EUTSA_v10019404mg [Eutrema salsugineum]